MPPAIEVNTQRLVKLYRSGLSLAVVGLELGISKSTAKRKLIQAGETIRDDSGSVAFQVVGEDGLRPCYACRKRLPALAFYRNRSRPDGLAPSCKQCCSTYHSEKQMWYVYRISIAEYHEILKRQGGGCGICGGKLGITKRGRRYRLPVDHCHRTKKIRGILCNDCNNGLGRFKDNPELLLKAVQYLKR